MLARCKVCGTDLTMNFVIGFCDDHCPIKNGVIGTLKHSKVKYEIISGAASQKMTKIKYVRNGIELEVPTRELWENSIWK